MKDETNQDILKVGDRVELTDDALRLGLDGRLKRNTGIVTKVSKINPEHIRVRREGAKQTERWSAGHWKIKPADAQGGC
jgi:hypothetical protein